MRALDYKVIQQAQLVALTSEFDGFQDREGQWGREVWESSMEEGLDI